MSILDEMTDAEYLKEVRELLRFLLEPKSLEEEVGGVQDRGLGSRRKRNHAAAGTFAVAR